MQSDIVAPPRQNPTPVPNRAPQQAPARADISQPSAELSLGANTQTASEAPQLSQSEKPADNHSQQDTNQAEANSQQPVEKPRSKSLGIIILSVFIFIILAVVAIYSEISKTSATP